MIYIFQDAQDKMMRILYMRATNNERNMDAEEFMVALNEIFLKGRNLTFFLPAKFMMCLISTRMFLCLEYGAKGRFGIESARSLLAMTDVSFDKAIRLKQ